MKALVLFAILAITAYAEERDDVLILTDANYANALANSELLFIKFYAPWSGHCKRLAPEWVKAATTLKDKGSSIALAKTDCTVEKDFCEKYRVSGYPTLKFFAYGELVEQYTGKKTESDIVDYCLKKEDDKLLFTNTNTSNHKLTNAEAITNNLGETRLSNGQIDEVDDDTERLATTTKHDNGDEVAANTNPDIVKITDEVKNAPQDDTEEEVEDNEPDKTPDEAPSKTPDEAPSKTPDEAPAKTPEDTLDMEKAEEGEYVYTNVQDSPPQLINRTNENTTKMAFLRQHLIRSLQKLQIPGIKAEDVLKDPDWPPQWPYSPQDFTRQDESKDFIFYVPDRFVYHIDDHAVNALTQYYKYNIAQGSDVLDICSSWVSHYPQNEADKYGRVAGLGMNQQELERNEQLTEFTVKDLNEDPVLPYEDNSFDVVTIVVSVDYLNKPLQIFSEINRVLKPGGKVLISQSNRFFPTKVIQMWMQTNDLEHIYIIGSYFHYAGNFTPPQAEDISPNPGRSDPMYIISAKKVIIVENSSEESKVKSNL